MSDHPSSSSSNVQRPASSKSMISGVEQKRLELLLIDCGLPDYVIATIKLHRPNVEVVESVLNYAEESNAMLAELRQIVMKTKAERDNLKAMLKSKSTVPRSDYDKLRAEKQASDDRVRDYAEDLANQNFEIDRYKREVKELEGFVQQHLDSIDRLGQEKKQLIAQISALKSSPVAQAPPPQQTKSDLQVKFIKQGSELAAERVKLAEATKKLQEFDEIRAKLEADLDGKSKKCDELEHVVAEKEGVIGSQKNEIWRHEVNIASLDRQVADQNSKIADLRSELGRWKAENATLESSTNDLNDAKAKFDEQTKRIDELVTQISAKNTEIEQGSTRIKQLEGDLDAKSKQISQLERRVSSSKQLPPSSSNAVVAEELRRKNDDLSEQLAKLKSELAQEREQNAKLQSDLCSERKNVGVYMSKYEAEKTSYAQYAKQSNEVSEFRKKKIEALSKALLELRDENRRLKECDSRTGRVSAGDFVNMTSPNDQVLADDAVFEEQMMSSTADFGVKKRKLSIEGQCEVPSTSPHSDDGNRPSIAVANNANDEPIVYVDQKEVQQLKDTLQTLANEVTNQKETIKELEAKVTDADAKAAKGFNSDLAQYEFTSKRCQVLQEKLDNLERHISQHLIRLESSLNIAHERQFLRDILLREIRLESVEDGECISFILPAEQPPPLAPVLTVVTADKNDSPPLPFDYRQTLSRQQQEDRPRSASLRFSPSNNNRSNNFHHRRPGDGGYGRGGGRGNNNNYKMRRYNNGSNNNNNVYYQQQQQQSPYNNNKQSNRPPPPFF